MMKRIFSFLIISSFLLGCSSSTKNISRDPQQAETEYVTETNAAAENTFQILINHPEKTRDQDFAKFLRRQMGYFYIANELVHEFDQELEKLYQEKKKNVDSEPDQKKLEEIKAKLYFSWEFFDRNLDELTYIYSRLLEEAGNPNSQFKTAATHTLSGMAKFFEEGWKKGDQMAVLKIAHEYYEIGQRYKEKHPEGKTPSFVAVYAKKADDDKEVAAAYAQSLKHHKLRKKRYVDSVLEKDWSQYVDKRKVEAAQEAAWDRQPNADTLYPSPGGTGNITGNLFTKGYWALTFDDGPHPTHTQGMIDALNSVGYDGTFFWLTQNIKLYPKLVDKAGAEGFRRASHSYTHANLPKLGPKDLNHEINDAYDGFKQIVGQGPTLFRCPYGACNGNNSTIRKMIADKNMMHVFWNVDSLDWQDKNAESVFQRTKKQMEVNGKGIVLFHDIHPQSVKATKMLVEWMAKDKSSWKVLTLDRMIQEETANDPKSPDSSKKYYSP